MTDENVDALRRAGCAEAWMGVESGSQAVLDAMDKGITLDEVRGAVARLRAAGIRIGFFLQFGYPGRGLARDRDDPPAGPRARARRDRHLGQLPAARNEASTSACGSTLGEKRNWNESNDLDPLFPGRFSREFYQTLSRTVHAEFRTRRALRALRELARAPLSIEERLRERLQALGGFAEFPIWIAGQARLFPQTIGSKTSKQLP